MLAGVSLGALESYRLRASRRQAVLSSSQSVFFAFIVVMLLSIVGCGGDSADGKQDIYKSAVNSWDRPLRDHWTDRRRKPLEILRFAQAEPGMVIVDLLGGGGYYSEILGQVVGSGGRVYLQNNSLFLRFSTEKLEKRLKGQRLENVIRLDSEFADLELPQNVDMIFMGLCYHDIYVPREDPTIMTSRDEFFPQIWESLKSGGRILVIDHAAEPGSGTAASPWHHRIAEDYAIEDFQNAGFLFRGSIDVLRNPDDDYSLQIWDEKVLSKTDKFVLLFEKP